MSSQPESTVPNQPFRFFRQFNEQPFAKKADCRDRLRESDTRWFPGDYLSSKFARALCTSRAVPFKELLESFEFYACTRRQLKYSTNVADLCCGHGLVGIVFAMFEKRIERVLLLDKVRPASFDVVLDTANQVAPWVGSKIEYITSPISHADQFLDAQTAVLGVHACGSRTDECIRLAINVAGPLAVLPCCRDHSESSSPDCIKKAFGTDTAIDIDRTYRLHQNGFRVRWDTIPETITPMNRVLVGMPQPQGVPNSDPCSQRPTPA